MLNILLAIIVSAQIDSTSIWVGDQTTLHLQATQEKTEQVQFPVYGEQLMDGIDVVEQTMQDTTVQADGRLCIRKDLTITSFNDSLFFIKPLPFTTPDGDTLFTESLSLNVIQPFEIDTADQAITDIKDVYRPKIWWWGIIRWVLLGLLLAGAAVGGIFLYRWWVRRKGEKTEPVNPELLRPAHEVALEKLDAIKEAKIWQQGQHKEYHTNITDVIREYIARRFEVSSQEKTSDETLRELKPLMTEQRDLFNKLQKMLRLADMVKFAKWMPNPDENEISLHTAYQFVNETTVIEENVDDDNQADAKNTDADIDANKN